MERIGSYAVERKLGEGGMGTVWLARSRSGRLIAVKVARPELAGDPTFRERFRAEVAAARTVGGFHTAPVVDADPDAEQPWLATAYVPGPTLARLLAEHGPMDEAALRALGVALAEALQAIHRCGLVHRDLKPGNIVMAEDGPRVLDIGIARAVEQTRLTLTGTAFGTPGFLAPEQAEGRDVGPAADVFALGAVLVAAAGGSAFGRGNPVALMYRSVHQEPDLGAVPEALRPVVAACLAKAPGRRPDAVRLLDWLSPRDEPSEIPVDGGPADLARDVPVDRAPRGESPTGYALQPPAPRPRPTDPPAEPPPAVPPAAPPRLVTPPPPPSHAPAVPPGPYAPAYGQASPYGPWNTPCPPGGYGPPAPYGPPVAPEPGPQEPEFLAMDRRNAVVADSGGVSLGTDGHVLAFPWQAVDEAWCEPLPGRKPVLVVAVSLYDGSLHTCEVTTRRPGELASWQRDFTAVTAHFKPAQG